MLNKREEGFTLIEILVGINLSFILVTLLISFYLFSVKFTSTTTTKLNEKQNISNFLFLFNERLKKSEEYYFVQKNKEELFILDDRDTVSFNKSSFTIKNLFKINYIEKYLMTIELLSGERLSFLNGERVLGALNSKLDNSIPSSKIHNVEISFSVHNKNYHLIAVNYLQECKGFKNISR